MQEPRGEGFTGILRLYRPVRIVLANDGGIAGVVRGELCVLGVHLCQSCGFRGFFRGLRHSLGHNLRRKDVEGHVPDFLLDTPGVPLGPVRIRL